VLLSLQAPPNEVTQLRESSSIPLRGSAQSIR
jgi:hypothetical protein